MVLTMPKSRTIELGTNSSLVSDLVFGERKLNTCSNNVPDWSTDTEKHGILNVEKWKGIGPRLTDWLWSGLHNNDMFETSVVHFIGNVKLKRSGK